VPQLRRLPARLPVRAATRVRGEHPAGHGARARPTYQDYAWPPALGRLYQRNGLVLCLALAAALALFLALAVALRGGLWAVVPAGGSFYDLFPHNLMVGLFAPVFGFAVLALGMGVRRFWREITPVTSGAALNAPAAAEATHDVLRLKYLDGGHGQGCNNADDAFTLWRRRCHHLTFYGFMLCFAATAVATLYHYAFGWAAPYDLPSLPKLLGGVGGVTLALGTAGLAWLNLRRDPAHGDAAQKPMDLGFIALLFLTATSGLGLWWARGSAAMPSVLCLHLGAVMALFATLPYGKFAHGIFRSAALARHAVEKRRPNPVGLGAD
jgi:citrate/tricarballylate utilization protein